MKEKRRHDESLAETPVASRSSSMMIEPGEIGADAVTSRRGISR